MVRAVGGRSSVLALALIVSGLAALADPPQADAGRTVTRALTLGPLLIPPPDLIDFLKAVDGQFILGVGGSFPPGERTVVKREFTLIVDDDGSESTILLRRTPVIGDLPAGASVARVEARYYAFSLQEERSASVRITLSEYERTIVAAANSEAAVDSALGLAERRLAKFVVVAGGSTFRVRASMLVFVALTAAFGAGLFSIRERLEGSDGSVLLLFLALFLTGFLATQQILSMFLDSWFPGFSTRESWAVRYGPDIGLLSLVVSGLGLGLPLLKRRGKGASGPKGGVPPTGALRSPKDGDELL